MGDVFGSFEHLLFGLIDKELPFDSDHGFWTVWGVLSGLLSEERLFGGRKGTADPADGGQSEGARAHREAFRSKEKERTRNRSFD